MKVEIEAYTDGDESVGIPHKSFKLTFEMTPDIDFTVFDAGAEEQFIGDMEYAVKRFVESHAIWISEFKVHAISQREKDKYGKEFDDIIYGRTPK